MSTRRRRTQPRGLLVDTNLLVLLTVGSLEPGLIERHKRTNKFTAEDYQILRRYLGKFRLLVTTPNILTEASNLVDQVGQPISLKLQERLAAIIGVLDEQYVGSRDCCGLEEFRRLGLADSSILRLTQDQGDLAVLTDDFHLYLALQKRGLVAENFNHLRERLWK